MDVVETRLFIQDPGGHEGEGENGRSSVVVLKRWPSKSESERGSDQRESIITDQVNGMAKSMKCQWVFSSV